MLLSITSSAAFETRISISIASAYFKIDFLIPLLSTPPLPGGYEPLPPLPAVFKPIQQNPLRSCISPGLTWAVYGIRRSTRRSAGEGRAGEFEIRPLNL